MKSTSATLIALLETGDFVDFDLYDFSLVNGLTLRYTTADVDVVWNGNTYSSVGPLFDEDGNRAVGHWKNSLDVDTWQVVLSPRPTDLIGTTPWMQAVRAGMLDGAIVDVRRAFLAAWPSPPQIKVTVPAEQATIIFSGRIADLPFGRSSVTININDFRELLTVQMPRNVYSAQCRYTLFDSGCALNRDSFAVPASVTQTGSAPQAFYCSATAYPDWYFALGYVRFTSGANNNLQMMIRASGAGGQGVISMMAPLPFPIAVGDTMVLYPGCDKQQSTCTSKFNNLANFGGFPSVPAPETAT